MLLKKLIFLMLPLIVIYWRSRAAQGATKWLFRGVIPEEGTLGKVISELRDNPSGNAPTDANGQSTTPRRAKRSLAAEVADRWPIVLAFIAGVSLAAILFSRSSHQD